MILGCYAARCKDASVLRNSASGGIFYALARRFIELGGCVFGCSLDTDDFVARHVKVDQIADLQSLQGSKYVQSELGVTFNQCIEELKRGRRVLFSGTPCQIVALRHYLSREHCDQFQKGNLLLVDLICHGVPMRDVFDKYKKELIEDLGGKLEYFAFRNKEDSWRRGRLVAKTSQAELNIPYGESPYIKAFVRGLSLMECCYRCHFKGDNRAADITLGDCWGIDILNPKFANDKGTSLVVIHTEVGHRAFNVIKDQMEAVEVKSESSFRMNLSYSQPTKKPLRRERFLARYKTSRLSDIIEECSRLPWWYRGVIRRVVKI